MYVMYYVCTRHTRVIVKQCPCALGWRRDVVQLATGSHLLVSGAVHLLVCMYVCLFIMYVYLY